MNIKKNIAISDTGFVFDPSNGNSFTTNAIGLEIIKLFQSGKETEEIKKEILDRYTIDAMTLERDVNDFIHVLLRMKLADL